MELTPSEPPGHARRKLRGLASEIARLRAAGYTIRSIHQALADAGVEVGWSTVQREAARLAKPSAAANTDRQRSTTPVPAVDTAEARPRASRGAVEVDSFFDTHNTNPLFKRKGKA